MFFFPQLLDHMFLLYSWTPDLSGFWWSFPDGSRNVGMIHESWRFLWRRLFRCRDQRWGQQGGETMGTFRGFNQWTWDLKKNNGWLVVWLPWIFNFPRNIGNSHHPNWLSYFSEGFKPPTSNGKEQGSQKESHVLQWYCRIHRLRLESWVSPISPAFWRLRRLLQRDRIDGFYPRGFWSHRGTPKSSKSDKFSIETHGDLGDDDFRTPYPEFPARHGGTPILSLDCFLWVLPHLEMDDSTRGTHIYGGIPLWKPFCPSGFINISIKPSGPCKEKAKDHVLLSARDLHLPTVNCNPGRLP